MEIDRAEIDCLLESCLDEVSGGQESIDSVLSRHPDVQENLRAELEAALWFRAQAQRLAARPGFIPRSRRHLYTQIRKEHPDRQFFKRKKMLQRWEKSPAAQLVLSILLVIALLANTNSLLAAARAAGPGDQFYGVKQACETFQLSLPLAPDRAVALHSQFAKDRLGEMVGLILEGRTGYLEAVVLDYEAHTGEALLALRALALQDPQSARELAGELEVQVFKQSEILPLLVHSVPEEQAPYLEQAKRVSDMGMAAVQALVREQAALP
jgi:hypothetical protein